MAKSKADFFEIFRSEAEDYVQTLDQGLVRLEKESSNLELLDELFRAAHTLKGCSRMMGFKEISDFAHKMESIFGEVKEGKETFTSEKADLVFESLDNIKALMKSALENEGVPEKKPSTKKEKVSTSNAKNISSEQKESSEPKVEAVSTPDSSGSEYMRVPLTRINSLLQLMGEIVVHKVKSSHKVDFFKRLCRELKTTQKQLGDLKNEAKEAMGVADEILYHDGTILRASSELSHAAAFFGRLHHMELGLERLSESFLRVSDEAQNEYFQLNPVIEELQHKMKEIRMLPCSVIFEGFPRLVRDIARTNNKDVDLKIKGESTELDKKVLEAIRGPLVHILRNAVDHGIESCEERAQKKKNPRASILLSATQERGRIIIEVRDDGRGLDLAKIKETALKRGVATEEELEEMTETEIRHLVFTTGFSTATMITDISGRGVGLDVVRAELNRLKGTVSISSEPDKGTTVHIELPLTIAVVEVLSVKAGGYRWAFPVSSVLKTMSVSSEKVTTVQNRLMVHTEERWIPAIVLADALGLENTSESIEKKDQKSTREYTALVIQAEHKEFGLLVDSITSQGEVFLKSFGSHLGDVGGTGGAAILADGSVIVILDPEAIARSTRGAAPYGAVRKKNVNRIKKKVLIVEDSMTTRELEKSILENSGYEVDTAIDGLDAMEKLSTGTYQAIVSDVQMPRMDGFELCHQVKGNEQLRDIPFVIVTSLSKDEEKRKGLELGAQAYLTKKQFDQGNLLKTLERLLA